MKIAIQRGLFHYEFHSYSDNMLIELAAQSTIKRRVLCVLRCLAMSVTRIAAATTYPVHIDVINGMDAPTRSGINVPKW